MHRRGAINLHELSKLAKEAMEGSELSLAAATEIADGNFISRLWNSGEMQKHIIQSISYLGDISKVNLGLSAICNDLAAANLEHASRIDKNHHATNQQLNQVQQLTAELLTHLRKPREPALLDRLLPALSKANPADQDAMRGWLRTLTEEIDLQYVVLQENLNKLSQKNDNTVESVARFRVEIASLSEALTNQKAEVVQQMGLLSSRLSASVSNSTQRADKTDATIRKSHETLAADLTTLNQQLNNLSQKNDNTVESVARFRVEITSISEALRNQKAEVIQQVGLLSSRLSASVSDAAQRADKTDGTIRKSHEVLAAALTTLNQQLARHQTEFQTAIQSERASREAMQQSIVSLIKQREGAIRTTIGELNQHLLKRMLWGAGGIVVLQVLGFGFLAFKMGFFK